MKYLKLTPAVCAALLLSACGGASDESSAVVTHGPLIISETTVTTTEAPPLTAVFTETTGRDENGEPVYPVISWRDAYAQKLRDYASTSGYIPPELNADSHSRYSISDLNGDGSPELMIAYNNDKTTPVQIYTMGADGMPMVTAEIGYFGAFEYDPAHGLLAAKLAEENANTYVGYKLTADGAVEQISLSDSLGTALYPPADWEPEVPTVEPQYDEAGNEIPAETVPVPEYGADASYLVNGNPVSRSEYLAYYQDYWLCSTIRCGGLYDFDVNMTPDRLVS